MAQGRPAIPADLKRRVMMEAGYRCAIPVCRAHPVAIEHIDDWAKVQKHSFENLIALCHNCHARKGNRPGQIDRKALLGYKANLGRLNVLYNDMERRMLETFAEQKSEDGAYEVIELDHKLHFMVNRLYGDGLIKIVRQAVEGVFGGASPHHYALTEAGMVLVDNMIAAEPVGDYYEGESIPEFAN